MFNFNYVPQFDEINQDIPNIRKRLLELKLKELESVEFYGGPSGAVPPVIDEITTESGISITTEGGDTLITE